MSDSMQLAGLGLLASVVIAIVAWLVSIPARDASVADRVWSAVIAVPAAVYVWRSVADARSLAMLVLIVVWAVRLAAFVTARNRGHGEDRRYRAMRERNQPHFALKSLVLVFLLQALLGWVVGLPVLSAADGGPWTAWDSAGAFVAAAGVAIEAVADAQLARFRRRPDSRDAVMDRGLWRYSRHPNYFGEACLWWGLAAMALAGGGVGRAWVLVSPLLMTVLLLRVSGVSLLEKDIADRRPAYRDYVARTSAFIPWPPRPGGRT